MRRRTFFRCAAATALAMPSVRAAGLASARIELGNEVFLRSAWRGLHGRRVGLITNQSGVTSTMEPLINALRREGNVNVTAIYAPEHGFGGNRQAGASVGSYVDPTTRLPVFSLYGAQRRPTAAMLAGVDVLLFDIQDVGSRAYTYISTLAYAMQGAKANGRPLWVLDRPNPVGGAGVEGPVLEPEFASFIGLYPIAMRHGMTVGELAQMFNDRFGIGSDLHVVAMNGWRRSMIWPDTGLQWIKTSPNIPFWQTTFVYLCTGLIDNAGLNNGVGYTQPFFLAGMVGVDGMRFARALNQRNLPGVSFRPATWSPSAGFWKNRELTGVELLVYDTRQFVPVRTAVEILVTTRRLFPHVLNVNAAGLDRDWGTASLRTGVLSGSSAEEIVAGWSPRLEAFNASREKYLLYT